MDGVLGQSKSICIVNPFSGGGKTAKIWPKLHAVLQQKLGKVDFKMTRAPKEATLLAKAAAITFMMSLRALRKGGRLLTVGNSGSPKFEIDNRYLFAKHLSILGSTMSSLAEFKEVMDLIVAGKLKPVMDKTFPLKDAALAQERLWKNENFGKITLDIS